MIPVIYFQHSHLFPLLFAFFPRRSGMVPNLLVFVLARNKVYPEVRQRYNRQPPLLEFGNGPTTFVQQLACCRFCVMQSLAFLLPRQQAEVSWHCSPQPSTFHLFDT